ncbi:hypothetical protein BH11BAC7_BH11BAC7_10930 [soil metagenome]
MELLHSMHLTKNAENLMKKLLFLSLIASVFTMVGFKESSKSLPQWYINATYVDKKLSKDESAFTFGFTADSGKSS